MHQKKIYVFSLFAIIGLVVYLNQDYLNTVFFPQTVVQKNQQNNPSDQMGAANVVSEKLTAKPQKKWQENKPNVKTVKANLKPSVPSPLINDSHYANLSNAEKLAYLKQKLNETAIDPVRVLLVPNRETTIASATQGRITHLVSQLGQRFNKGDLLASFDCNEKLANLDIAKADLASKMDQHEAKMKMQGLDQASDIEVALAASDANKARATLKLNQSLVNDCKIFAPWAGRVAKSHVKKHMIVAAGEPLLDIIGTGKLKLKFNMPSKQLSNIEPGQTFEVNIDETSKRYSARISAINSQVDPVSQTVEVEALLIKRYSHLLSGMSGTANIVGKEPSSQIAYK